MIEPVGQKVALEIITNLERYANELKKRSGLFINPNAVQGEPNTGRVYAISPEIKDPEYKIGDIVIFKRKGDVFMGHRFDDKDLVFVEHDEVIASVDEASL